VWGGQAKNKTKVKITWDITNLPNAKGGIKIFNLQAHARALLTKLVIRRLVFKDEP
jgi:hypothetical protein